MPLWRAPWNIWNPKYSMPNLKISADDSRQIEITRVICIALVVNSHWGVLPDPDRLETLPGEIFSATHRLAEIVSLSSVAALSLISGYLLFSGRKPTFGMALTRRLQSVYIPFLFWNTIFIGSVLLRCGVTTYTEAPCQAGFWPPYNWPVNYVSGLFGPPAAVHLSFLRDLIVSTALVVLAAPVVRRAPVIALLSVGLICLFKGPSILLVRPEILLCMMIGACIAFSGRNLAQASQAFPALVIGLPCVLFFVLSDIFVADQSQLYSRFSLLNLRIGLALVFIWVSWTVAQKAFSRHIEVYSRDIFFVYLAHPFLLNLFVLPVMNRMGLRGDLWLEGLLIFLLPLLSVLVFHHCGRLVDRLPPGGQLLVRGRVRQHAAP